MKTASFRLYPAAGAGRISIARWAPRGYPKGYRVLKDLAPAKDMMRLSYPLYRDRYFRDILGRLDPQATWDRLHQLADNTEPVLLCWETLRKPNDWCHRRMVAEWFHATLGQDVPEWAPDADQINLPL